MLQELERLEEQGPDERVQAGLRGLTVGVKDPERGIDPDSQGVGSGRGGGIESVKRESGDGDGLGGPLQDLGDGKR